MKILWIDPLNTNPHYLNLMAVVLRDAGHEIHVCAMVRAPFPAPPGVRWLPFAPRARPVFAFKRRWLAAFGLVAGYPLHWRRAIRYARRCGVHAVVISTNLALRRVDAWAMRRLRQSGLKAAVVVHKPWQTSHRDGQAKAAHRAFYRQADRVLTMDDHTRAFLRSACGVAETRFRHLPFPHFEPLLSTVEANQILAHDLAEWAKAKDGSTAPVIAFLSQMRLEHGFDDLLAALPTIGTGLADWRLLVVSSSVPAKRRAAVEERLAKLGFRDRCWLRWAPYSFADLKAFLGAASMIVTPYKWAGRSVVTACAIGAGVPIVATDVGGLATGIRPHENGEVVPPNEPDALAAAIVKVAGDLPGYRERAREPHEDFAPARAAAALTGVLRELEQAGRGSAPDVAQ